MFCLSKQLLRQYRRQRIYEIQQFFVQSDSELFLGGFVSLFWLPQSNENSISLHAENKTNNRNSFPAFLCFLATKAHIESFHSGNCHGIPSKQSPSTVPTLDSYYHAVVRNDQSFDTKSLLVCWCESRFFSGAKLFFFRGAVGHRAGRL